MPEPEAGRCTESLESTLLRLLHVAALRLKTCRQIRGKVHLVVETVTTIVVTAALPAEGVHSGCCYSC